LTDFGFRYNTFCLFKLISVPEINLVKGSDRGRLLHTSRLK
jgi:hypothetical protein